MSNKYKIAIAGGGPAGLMAAAAASEMGARTIIVEKMPTPGKKLLLTGNGRCNISNTAMKKPNLRDIYGEEGVFLNSAAGRFDYDKVMSFFEHNGLLLKNEADGRIFPASDKSGDVLEMFLEILKKNHVDILTDTPVISIETYPKNPDRVKSFVTPHEKIEADQFIVNCGGKSFPHTGSTGDSFKLAEQTGHKVIKPHPALVPIKVRETWIKKLQGLTLDDVGIQISAKGKILYHARGSVLFTHFGISGPQILNLSGKISGINPDEDILIRLNLIKINPEKENEIKTFMADLLAKNSKKNLSGMLRSILPERAAMITAELAGMPPDKKVSVITKAERQQIAKTLTSMEMTYAGTTGFNQAMLTGGGIDPAELYPATMRSRHWKNLYFAGEALALDGPTGGYNLHMCWLTGFIAGKSAAEEILSD